MNISDAGISILAFALACSPVTAQEPPDAFDTLPARDPQPLQQLADLDDAQFQNAIAENNGARFRAIVAEFDPPGLSVFPVSHGFAGVKEACLRARVLTACRLYTIDLLTVQREKRNRAGVTNNPFGTPAR